MIDGLSLGNLLTLQPSQFSEPESDRSHRICWALHSLRLVSDFADNAWPNWQRRKWRVESDLCLWNPAQCATGSEIHILRAAQPPLRSAGATPDIRTSRPCL
jgi:hypothetical protein